MKHTIVRTMRNVIHATAVASALFALASPKVSAQTPRPATAPAPGLISIAVNLNQRVGAMTPVWAYFGYDEPNYTYLPDGRKLLTELADMSPVPVYVRAHNMLTTNDGPPVALKWGSTNAYTEDASGKPVYNWNMVDRIVDVWVERGMKPLMEIGFMPKALSVKPDP
jgi:xylan 1,4-beta-xylosidase